MRALFYLLLVSTFAVTVPVENTRDLTPSDFTRLGSRPLGMGGAWAGYGPDEQALFHNPAALATLKSPRIGSSHSARHFPGPEERDQLDADPTALVWPVTPFLTIGNGWVTQGELGYAHHDLFDEDFPKQHLWGRERVDGLGVDLLLLKLGAAHREQSYRYWQPAGDDSEIPNDPALDAPIITMEGEGFTTGGIVTVGPGIRYGKAVEKLDQDYMPSDPQVPSYGVTRTTDQSGWTIHPTGWLAITSQTDRRTYKTNHAGTKNVTAEEPIRRFGVELILGPLGALRYGSVNGRGSWGGSLHFFRTRLHWGESNDQMQELVPLDSDQEWPAKYGNSHHYSWSVGL